jgi:hypothetical protein
MQHRISGLPHRPVGPRRPAHGARPHIFVPAGRPSGSIDVGDDADYLNASPVARFIARLLTRFF